MKRCCECEHWKINRITQKTGMAICPKKKKFTSYQEACGGYTPMVFKKGNKKD